MKYLVLGMARSGIAAADLLAGNGITAMICDKKTEKELGSDIAVLHEDNVEWHLGEDPMTLLDSADALVLSPGIPDTHPCVQAMRAAGKEVMAEIELAWRCFPGTTAAITGTNGKTTTTTLVTEILTAAGHKASAVGNIGVPFTGICSQAKAQDYAVCEVSSFQMETCSRFHPHVAAILNITPDHLNRHGTMDVYIALKERTFANMLPDEALVLNYDDPITRDMAKRSPARVCWFSRTCEPEFGAFVQNGNIVYGTPEKNTVLCPADEVRIPGAHNLENALAASAMTMELGVAPEVIAKVLREFPGVEHRIETFAEFGGVTWINDSKGTNTDSTIRAVRTMTKPTVLIAGGSEKKQDFAEMSAIIRDSMVREVVLIGLVAPQMERQLREAGFTNIHNAGYDFEKAIHMSAELARSGWNVLLSPANASFDMFPDYEERGRIFKNLVNRLGAEQR